MRTPTLHLGPQHPLAGVAAGHCAEHSAPLVGGIACGSCWEQAIRDDERFVTEFDLPRELHLTPDDVDEVAVERACDGDRLQLTEPELIDAVRRLRRRGLTVHGIIERLHAPERLVTSETAGVPAGRMPAQQARRGVAA